MAWVFFAESWALGSSVEYTPYNFLIGLLFPVVFYFVYKTFLDPKNQKKDHKFHTSEKTDYENENFETKLVTKAFFWAVQYLYYFCCWLEFLHF